MSYQTENKCGCRGFVIAGTSSGAGKTTITLGLMSLLKRKGYKVAPFKVGPDYIDPGHHSKAVNGISRNLDGWMLTRNYNVNSFTNAMQNKDIAVVEGVMGLYDGYSGSSDRGSTAEMAKWLDLPVVLVVNAQSMARSAAALVSGFENFDEKLRFAGVIFNNIGSLSHLEYLKEAMASYVKMPCLGGVRRNRAIKMPERHLGLVTDDENPLDEAWFSSLADIMEESIDPELLQSFLKKEIPKKAGEKGGAAVKVNSEKVTIAIARDKAFCFYYQDNIDILEGCGATIVYFSPLKDTSLPEHCDGIYFGGGYPELFAAELSENRSLRLQIKALSDQGMPVYGECGGFMYLCSDITLSESMPAGNRPGSYQMTGCFPFSAKMNETLKSLGYREVVFLSDTLLGQKGETIKGHEFHYSSLSGDETGDSVYDTFSGKKLKTGTPGYQTRNTLGSYIHVHMGSNPATALHFVEKCRAFRQQDKDNYETTGN
jgi:cobyrinic acid a,c-diamide synthase